MIIHYSNARPGSGKTYRITERMATKPAKYLYAVDRNEVVGDRTKLLHKFYKSNLLPVVELNSDVSGSVRQEVKDAPTRYGSEKHVVVIISHEGLMTSDLSHYSGWHLCIDEIPNAWTHTEVQTKESNAILDKHFTIRKPRGQLAQKRSNKIRVKENADIESLAFDTYVSGMMAMYKAAKNGKAYSSVEAFDQEKKWDWWTIWDFRELEVFSTVTLVANAFEESLTFKLMQSQGIQLQKFNATEFAEYEPRKLLIKYFDQNNRATSYFFSSGIGKDALKAVGKYLRKYPVDIWSCNNAKKRINHRKLIGIQSGCIKPCVAGSNDYIDYTSAAFIYSAKPSKTEMARLAELGIDFEDVVRSREIEPAIQFVTRLSIRNPDDRRDNVFFVYDKLQAESVKEFFDNLGIGISTELEFINLGIPKVFQSAEDKRAKRTDHDRVMYLKKKAARASAKSATVPQHSLPDSFNDSTSFLIAL